MTACRYTRFFSRTSMKSCFSVDFPGTLFLLCSSNQPWATRSISVAAFFMAFSCPSMSNHLNQGSASAGTKTPASSKKFISTFRHRLYSSPWLSIFVSIEEQGHILVYIRLPYPSSCRS